MYPMNNKDEDDTDDLNAFILLKDAIADHVTRPAAIALGHLRQILAYALQSFFLFSRA